MALHHSSLASKSTTPGFQPNPSNPFEHPSPHINPIAMASSQPTIPQRVYSSLTSILTKIKNKITLRILPKSTLTLLSLPPELLQEIAHLLPPESAMSLNLTSKATFSSLPFAAPAALLRRDRDARFRFLKLVGRDLNHNCSRFHYVCHTCGTKRWRKQDGDRSVPGCEHVIRVRVVRRGS